MSKKNTVPEPKHVASLDFDHCLYQGGRGNKALKDTLFRTELNQLQVSELYVGTSRQSTQVELLNISARNGASYERFETFAGESFTLHRGLTADAWTHNPFGHTFQKTKDMVKTLDAETVCDAMEDDEALKKVDSAKNASPVVPGFSTKIDILYMQMQDAYRRSGGQPVVFHFYDDSERILDALNAFYSRNPKLMPANMTLQLHKVAGNDISLHKSSIKSRHPNPLVLTEEQIAACTRAGLAKAADYLIRKKQDCAMDHKGVTTLDYDPSFSQEAKDQFKNGVSRQEAAFRHQSWLLASRKTFTGLVSASVPLLALAATFTALAAPAMVLASNPLMIVAAAVVGLVLVSTTVFAVFLGQANHVSKHSVLQSSTVNTDNDQRAGLDE